MELQDMIMLKGNKLKIIIVKRKGKGNKQFEKGQPIFKGTYKRK